MKIIEIFYNVHNFFVSLRQSGTTELLKKIAAENDVWVLVPTEEMQQEFGEKALTFDRLHKMVGFYPKPVLVDNFTMLKLSEMGYIEIEKLNDKIKSRNKLILSIKHEISSIKNKIEAFERTNRFVD